MEMWVCGEDVKKYWRVKWISKTFRIVYTDSVRKQMDCECMDVCVCRQGCLGASVPTKHSLAPVGLISLFLLGYLSFPPMLFAFSFGVIPFCLFAFLSGARKHDIILFAPAYVPTHAHWSVRIYIIRSGVDYCSRKCQCLLKSQLFWNFFLEIFGGMENS